MADVLTEPGLDFCEATESAPQSLLSYLMEASHVDQEDIFGSAATVYFSGLPRVYGVFS